MAVRIGLLSDTHSFLDESVFKYFAECDEIWHAGDIGNMQVLNQLSEFKPLFAVYGNIGGHEIRKYAPLYHYFVRENCRILITHIAGPPLKYNPETRKLLENNPSDILVCGHSHITRVQYDQRNKLLYMNPGACGKHGFHKVKTILRFTIHNGKPENLDLIELGPRA